MSPVGIFSALLSFLAPFEASSGSLLALLWGHSGAALGPFWFPACFLFLISLSAIKLDSLVSGVRWLWSLVARLDCVF